MLGVCLFGDMVWDEEGNGIFLRPSDTHDCLEGGRGLSGSFIVMGHGSWQGRKSLCVVGRGLFILGLFDTGRGLVGFLSA